MAVKEMTKFWETYLKKLNFHNFHFKNLIFINDINIKNIKLSNKHYLRKRNLIFFFFFSNHDDVKPWLIRLPKLSRFIKSFEKVKYK